MKLRRAEKEPSGNGGSNFFWRSKKGVDGTKNPKITKDGTSPKTNMDTQNLMVWKR